METRAATTQAARRRILDAALDELVAVGGEAVTLQGVAARADCALRTLYNHFPNRDALLTAAFSEHWVATQALVESIDVPDAEPEEQLTHIVAAYYSRYAEMGPRLTALLSLRGFPELEEQVRAIRAWRRRVIRQIVRRGRKAGAVTMPESAAVALVFTMTSHTTWETLVSELNGVVSNASQVACEALRHALFCVTGGAAARGCER
jgi:AcrR family transcriptional regulator